MHTSTVMDGMSRFQSQLSSIMEKLVVSAVTEINQLMCEYCTVLRVQLSRERQDSSAVSETPMLHRADTGFMRDSQLGNNEEELQQQVGQMKSKGTTDKQEERTLRPIDCKFEPNTVKSEDPSVEQLRLTGAPPALSATCLQVGENLPHQISQSCSEPPEASKDLHTDYNPSVEMQCRLSLSPSAAQFTDLGFQIKREAESPDLQTQGEDVNLSFELQQGILGQMYTESVAFPAGSSVSDTPVPTCFSSLQQSDNQRVLRVLTIPELSPDRLYPADRETPSHQFERRRAAQYRTPGRFKCDFCGKGFPFLSAMKGHRLSHTRERDQVCGQCGMTFIRRSHLKRHEMLHAGVKPFTCQVCGRSFTRQAHLSSHMKTHSM
ncbi:zinc finger protein ZFMSA12A-like [Xyrichtys novacula]|uniref:Zinc finger protein ZFMSA12A-like n=1 Tax=Xyrichtys novacula TaxID=13765 RepID=A0AAV1EW94_XYRNO|nr:zinc finger protein ZFMSA12A-like [Xyrichtys novacula]